MKKTWIMMVLLLMAGALHAQKLFKVETKGKGKPMILIHGLYCTGKVWDETVAYYEKNYECHIITLAGFGSNPPALQEPFLAGIKDEINAYVKEKKLKKPVIMGHSLGGFLAFWAAAAAPGTYGGVIAVDGVPFLTAVQMPAATATSAKSMAENMRNIMSQSTPEMTRMYQKNYLPTMINNPEKVNEVVEMAVASDPKTIGQVAYEMYTTDLRKDVASIDCPVLLMGAWIAYKDYGVTHDALKASYGQQVAAIKNVTLEITDTGKHFIFYDEFGWFTEKTNAFLAKL